MTGALRARPLPVAVALLALVALGLAASQVIRDRTPPRLFAQVPAAAPAGLPLELAVSANKPVTYEIRYGDLRFERVDQDVTFDFLVMPGDHTLEVVARDAFGNESTETWELYGVPAPQPLVRAPEAVVPGAPFRVSIIWAPKSVPIASLDVHVAGAAFHAFRTDEEAVVLAGVPLGTAPGRTTVEVSMIDGYGREVVATVPLEVQPETQPVQNLNVAPGILAVSTPANRALEEQALAEAYDASGHLDAPLWRAPFMLPAEGRFTSGYGLPRRYAQGGNVSYHHGTDIAAPEGTPIVAANDGVVVLAQFFPIKGGFTAIDHGASVFSLYFHQSRMLVEPGDTVRRGEIIGEIGTTGLSTGPHLHWEMRVNTISTDPMAWVGRITP